MRNFDAVTEPPNQECPYKIKVLNYLGYQNVFDEYCAHEHTTIRPLTANGGISQSGYIRIILVNVLDAPSKVRMWMDVRGMY